MIFFVCWKCCQVEKCSDSVSEVIHKHNKNITQFYRLVAVRNKIEAEELKARYWKEHQYRNGKEIQYG